MRAAQTALNRHEISVESVEYRASVNTPHRCEQRSTRRHFLDAGSVLILALLSDNARSMRERVQRFGSVRCTGTDHTRLMCGVTSSTVGKAPIDFSTRNVQALGATDRERRKMVIR